MTELDKAEDSFELCLEKVQQTQFFRTFNIHYELMYHVVAYVHFYYRNLNSKAQKTHVILAW